MGRGGGGGGGAGGAWARCCEVGAPGRARGGMKGGRSKARERARCDGPQRAARRAAHPPDGRRGVGRPLAARRPRRRGARGGHRRRGDPRVSARPPCAPARGHALQNRARAQLAAAPVGPVALPLRPVPCAASGGGGGGGARAAARAERRRCLPAAAVHYSGCSHLYIVATRAAVIDLLNHATWGNFVLNDIQGSLRVIRIIEARAHAGALADLDSAAARLVRPLPLLGPRTAMGFALRGPSLSQTNLCSLSLQCSRSQAGDPGPPLPTPPPAVALACSRPAYLGPDADLSLPCCRRTCFCRRCAVREGSLWASGAPAWCAALQQTPWPLVYRGRGITSTTGSVGAA
jgi:hypothetical protein